MDFAASISRLLISWFEPPDLKKYAHQNWFIFPQISGWTSNIFELPPQKKPTEISFGIKLTQLAMSDFTTSSATQSEAFSLRFTWEIIACEPVSFTLLVCHQYVLQGKLFHCTSSTKFKNQKPRTKQKWPQHQDETTTNFHKSAPNPSVKHV